MDRAKIKMLAKEKIKGNLWTIWKPFLIVFVVTAVLTAIVGKINGTVGGILSFIISAVSTIFTIAINVYVLKFVRGEKPELNDIIECVKQKWLVLFLTGLLVAIFVVLWSILLVIPGIIAAFSYALANYIVVDSDLGAMETIKKSKEMMKGHKMDFFIFLLSFIGWQILASLTFGLLYIWLMPYMVVAVALFYENLSGRNVQETQIPVEEPNPIQE